VPEIQFREDATKHRFSSDELTSLIRITTLKHWMVLAFIYTFLITLFIWGCFGSIPTRVVGQGLLLSNKGTIEDVIMPAGSGRVKALLVSVGQTIQSGQVVARLDNQDVTNKIANMSAYYHHSNNQYQQLKITAAKDIADREATYESQMKLNQTTLETERVHLAQVDDLLKRKEDMAARGLVNKEQLLSSYNDHYAVKSKIDSLQNQMIQDKLSYEMFKQDYETKLRELNLTVANAKRELNDLEAQKDMVTEIKSTVNGVVTHVQVAIGDDVKEGEPLVSVASVGPGLDAVVFVPAQLGQRIKPGAEVLVSPATIKKAEYGSMIASADAVGRFPSTKESMLAVLHNPDLIDEFLKAGTPIELRSVIEMDKNTPSGYRWTTGQGPDQPMVPGMLVTAMVTVKTQAPVTLIIPFLRHLFYGDPL
jgi:HlyD family secretion protein